MPNFGAKILNTAVSSLSAQQAVIATTANNIANVNTPGYARRQAQLETRAGSSGSGIDVGSGVQVADVQRLSDKFLEGLLQTATGVKGQDQVKSDYLSRIDALFDLTGVQTTIGSSLNEFFSAANQVALNPSNVELRSNLISRGQDVATTITSAYNTIAAVQTELDQRLSTEIAAVSSISRQIAELNTKVAQRESGGSTAGDERDQRDVLLTKLAEKLSFQTVETADGMVNIFTPDGFPLVNAGSSRSLAVTTNPSFSAGSVPPSLGGGALSYVVFDYGSGGATPSHIDLTRTLKAGGGLIGGILQLRGYNTVTNTSAFQADGDLVAVASRIESMARTLLTNVNQTYLGADENGGVAGLQPSSGDLNGATPAPFGLFDFNYAGTKDVDGDGIPELSDLLTLSPSVDNFASRLSFAVTTPAGFAAARDVDATAGVTAFPTGDGRNASAIAALRTTSFSFSTGSFALSSTFDDLYSDTVNYVGNAKATAVSNLTVSKANLTIAANRRDEVSGVSLDEEFANLIKFQRAFQASAKMIGTAKDLLDQIVNLL
jgi:flagellar hook-associated protein 1 FlgK